MGPIIGFTRKCNLPIVANICEWLYSKLGYRVQIIYVIPLNLYFMPYMGESHIEVKCGKWLK